MTMVPELFGELADVQACEERLMNCWPSHQSVVAGDWLCRFAKGYSGRANSACVVRPAPALDAATITHVEQIYGAANLRPSFRLSPLVGNGLREMLEAQGYRPEDAALGMIAPAFPAYPSPDLHLSPQPTPDWVSGACRWQEGVKQDTSALMGIVSNIRVPTRHATFHHEGQPAAYALVSLDRGMAEIGAVMVNPALRGKGLGRGLVRGVIGWAHSAGATRIFLQAATDNGVAKALYASLGFTALYTTAYWRKPD